MTNRVLLNASGLKVSKPGYDVLSASPAQLQFSSDWAGLGYYTQADINCNWNESAFRSYSLGKSFPSPPIVFLSRVDGSNLVHYGPVGYVFWEYHNNLENPIKYNQAEVAVQVTASAILIKSLRQNESGDAAPVPAFVLRYTVMHYNL